MVVVLKSMVATLTGPSCRLIFILSLSLCMTLLSMYYLHPQSIAVITTVHNDVHALVGSVAAAIADNEVTTTAEKSKEETPTQQQQPSMTTTDRSMKDDKASTTTKKKKTDTSPMNIVLLYADDWTYNTLGAMGNTYVKTPVLDALASQGILFTHNCVTTSICMQSRATLYTGQYVSQHQTLFSWRNVHMYEINRWNQTLYPLMVRNNYHVGFVGKYHHLEPPPLPSFHYFVSSEMTHYPRRGNGTTHITEWNVLDATDFLQKRPTDKPFFLTVSFFATHAEDGMPERYRPMKSSMTLYENDPVPIPKTMSDAHWKQLPYFFHEENFGRGRFRGRYDTPELHQHMMKNTYRMATEVDTACGTILNLLEKQNVLDNTLIIFTTDNGNFHGEHGLAEKWYPYEESIRVPLIVKDPRMPASLIGTKNDEFTLNIDLAPTILSAANIAVPSVMQGRDMAPLYLDETHQARATWRKDFLYEFFYDIPFYIPHSVALVGKGFKYIYWMDHNYPQYFNLTRDPYEEYDIINTTDTAFVAELKRRLTELETSVKNGLVQ